MKNKAAQQMVKLRNHKYGSEWLKNNSRKMVESKRKKKKEKVAV